MQGRQNSHPTAKRRPFLSSGNCHLEKIHPYVPRSFKFQKKPEIWIFMRHLIFKIGSNLSNSKLAELNMSLAPRVPVFAFICEFLLSSSSALKASEGGPGGSSPTTPALARRNYSIFNTRPAFTPLCLHSGHAFVRDALPFLRFKFYSVFKAKQSASLPRSLSPPQHSPPACYPHISDGAYHLWFDCFRASHLSCGDRDPFFFTVCKQQGLPQRLAYSRS